MHVSAEQHVHELLGAGMTDRLAVPQSILLVRLGSLKHKYKGYKDIVEINGSNREACSASHKLVAYVRLVFPVVVVLKHGL